MANFQLLFYHRRLPQQEQELPIFLAISLQRVVETSLQNLSDDISVQWYLIVQSIVYQYLLPLIFFSKSNRA